MNYLLTFLKQQQFHHEKIKYRYFLSTGIPFPENGLETVDSSKTFAWGNRFFIPGNGRRSGTF